MEMAKGFGWASKLSEYRSINSPIVVDLSAVGIRLIRISRRAFRLLERTEYCARSFRALSVTKRRQIELREQPRYGPSSLRLSMRACFCAAVMVGPVDAAGTCG